MKKPVMLVVAFAAAISLSSSLAAQDGKNRKVTIENLSSQPVFNIYASPITAKTWEEDMLGDGTIAAGASKIANIDNGTPECRYDLKAVMANGQEHVHRDVNVCAVSKWVIGETGASIQ